MGLVEQLKGSKVGIDTAPLIYFVEKHPIYLNVVRPVFKAIEVGNIEAMTSTITLLEVLVHLLRTNNLALAKKYKDILLSSEHFTTVEILHDISERSAQLRATYGIKTPDALQIACALFYGAETFITNDADLRKVTDIEMLVVNDFITP